MRLGLSSAAAPDATLDELLSACVRRGLSSLELRAGDAHGVGVTVSPADTRARATAAGVVLAGLRSTDEADEVHLARVAAAADTFVVLDGGTETSRIERARRPGLVGAPVAVAVETVAGLDEVLRRGCDFVWDIVPGSTDAEPLVDRILDEADGRLRGIRIDGGGPETAMHEGRGVGPLVGRLALGGYSGPLVVAPSSDSYRVAWQAWLGRRGGWGCGSAGTAPAPVRLDGSVSVAGGYR